MPIYEYRCQKGHTFEVRQGFTDDPVAECELCSAPVGRVFRPIAVHFKGSGFYNTDYGTRNRSRELQESKESSKREAKESAKSEGKDGSSKSDGAKDSGGSSNSTDSRGSKSDSGGPKKSESKAKAAD